MTRWFKGMGKTPHRFFWPVTGSIVAPLGDKMSTILIGRSGSMPCVESEVFTGVQIRNNAGITHRDYDNRQQSSEAGARCSLTTI